MWIADKWTDYEVIDTSSGEKLERWSKYYVVRPDPQIIWNTLHKDIHWTDAHGHYKRSSSGGGQWDMNKMPESIVVNYKDLKFKIRPTGFKHMGLFPEQACNWDWLDSIIKKANHPIRVLNLFAYTGGASVACAKAGASVCHVDASKGMTSWAKENAQINDIDNIRFIVDDCIKFVSREIRRGSVYDGLILDPPSYGRGPGGEIWKLESELYELLSLCSEVMNKKPLFALLNSYTSGLSATCMHYMMGLTFADKFGGSVLSDEIGLPVTSSGYILPCGSSVRWTAGDVE